MIPGKAPRQVMWVDDRSRWWGRGWQCTSWGGELTDPDGEEGDSNEDGGGDGAHGVGPAPGAVHQPVEQAQPPLEQRRPRRVQYDLEVALHGIWALSSLQEWYFCLLI